MSNAMCFFFFRFFFRICGVIYGKIGQEPDTLFNQLGWLFKRQRTSTSQSIEPSEIRRCISFTSFEYRITTVVSVLLLNIIFRKKIIKAHAFLSFNVCLKMHSKESLYQIKLFKKMSFMTITSIRIR